MVEASLQHIIGTVALVGLVVSACLFYTVFTSFIQADNRKNQLEQISENMASNVEEMINLAKFSKYDLNYSVKIVDLPVSIGGEPYKIQLVNDSTQTILVHSFLATQPSISADSTIPYNSGDIPIKVETTETPYNFNAGADNITITTSGTIYAKNATAIWTNPDWSTSRGDSPTSITVGIGWVSG